MEQSFQTEIPSVEPTKTNAKKPLIIISIIVIALIVSSIGSYFMFFSSTEVDVFNGLTVSFSGVSGNGTMEIDQSSMMHEKPEIQNTLQKLLTYSYDEKELKNGDTVTLKLTNEDGLLSNFRIDPLTKEKTFTVEGLSTVPQTWDEVVEKEKLYEEGNQLLEVLRQKYTANFKEQGEKDFGEAVAVTFSPKLSAVGYRTEPIEKCGSSLTEKTTCATAILMYDYELSLPAPYYITGSNKGALTIVLTQLTQKDGQLQYKNIFSLDGLETRTENLDAAYNYLSTNGYTLNQM